MAKGVGTELLSMGGIASKTYTSVLCERLDDVGLDLVPDWREEDSLPVSRCLD